MLLLPPLQLGHPGLLLMMLVLLLLPPLDPPGLLLLLHAIASTGTSRAAVGAATALSGSSRAAVAVLVRPATTDD